MSDGGQEGGWEGVLGDGEGVGGRGGDGVYVVTKYLERFAVWMLCIDNLLSERCE